MPVVHTSPLGREVTPNSSADLPGLGLGTMLQLFPSQCAVSVRCWWMSVFSFWNMPTAQMLSAEIAVIAPNRLTALYSVLMFGLGTTLHRVPSQCSTSVS